MHVQAVIQGEYIKLAHALGIPDGMEVELDIHMAKPSYREQRELLKQLCGSWSDDQSIPEIFDEIAEQRKRSVPRDITFDLPS